MKQKKERGTVIEGSGGRPLRAVFAPHSENRKKNGLSQKRKRAQRGPKIGREKKSKDSVNAQPKEGGNISGMGQSDDGNELSVFYQGKGETHRRPIEKGNRKPRERERAVGERKRQVPRGKGKKWGKQKSLSKLHLRYSLREKEYWETNLKERRKWNADSKGGWAHLE